MVTSRHRILLGIIAGLLFAGPIACKGGERSWPKAPEDMRREQRGKLGGESFTLFDPDRPARAGNGGGGPSIGVNRYLWRASLDTFNFMPLASADPFGGVIITDWYEDPEAPGERFKANVVISDTALHASAVKVRIFKQHKEQGDWKDSTVNDALARDLENAILTRARELLLQDGN